MEAMIICLCHHGGSKGSLAFEFRVLPGSVLAIVKWLVATVAFNIWPHSLHDGETSADTLEFSLQAAAGCFVSAVDPQQPLLCRRPALRTIKR